MYVERIPNRNSPPAILLRESYRDGDKIRKRTLANLSDWPGAKIEALRRVLRGDAVASVGREALSMQRSLPHGHVAAALGTLRKLGLDRLLLQGGRRQPKQEVALCVAMIVARLIEPASKLANPTDWRACAYGSCRRHDSSPAAGSPLESCDWECARRTWRA